MIKYCFITVFLFLINIQNVFSFAAKEKGMDMDSYAVWTAYAFLAILTIFFLFFLSYSPKDVEKPVISNIKNSGAVSTVADFMIGDIMPALKIISYSVISVLVLYAVIFVLLVF